ncbi:hypothetical protein ABIB00_005438 [Bradyrhizobium sp. LB14.3]|uniref:hypothetical protein n=1 Tax=Bradyrhizobium sp. LB14.3 TaxID=3156328 RepID=UPI003399A4DB
MILQLSRAEPRSVFELVGSNENAVTFALGWTLEKSPALRSALLRILEVDETDGSVVIHLQRFGQDRGFSDLELSSSGNFHIIFEAKRGWDVPSVEQMTRYSTRLSVSTGNRMLVSVSAASKEYARRLPLSINGIALKHISWTMLSAATVSARSITRSPIEKLWLTELSAHLEGYVMVQQADDNLVYVVSLSSQPINPSRSYTWTDVVNIDNSYFHPVGPGGGWPSIPPTYMGFRYGGELKSVHHVDAFQVANNLKSLNPNWPDIDSSHFVYKLGPAMCPRVPVRSGRIVRNTRVRCAIDTLLSGAHPTIDAARDATDARRNATDSA